MPASDVSRVIIRLYCDDDHLMGTYFNEVSEKYPLYCSQCEDTVSGKYPFTIVATQEVNLRYVDIGTLLNLVRQEARRLGYGKRYSDDNASAWPARLKHLQKIARKLRTMRGEYDGIIR